MNSSRPSRGTGPASIDAAGLQSAAADAAGRHLDRPGRPRASRPCPGNTFSYYDQVLDRVRCSTPCRIRYRSWGCRTWTPTSRWPAARDEVAPLELTKWFDTNYHYLVPELDGPDHGSGWPATSRWPSCAEAQALGVQTRPVLIGPLTFLLLSKPVRGRAGGLRAAGPARPAGRRVRRTAGAARRGGCRVGPAGRTGVRRRPDAGRAGRAEPGLRPAGRAAAAAEAAGRRLLRRPRPGAAVAGGNADRRHRRWTWCPRRRGGPAAGAARAAARRPSSPGWSTDATSGAPTSRAALSRCATLLGSVGRLVVSTSCSLLHVPYDLDVETALDPEVARAAGLRPAEGGRGGPARPGAARTTPASLVGLGRRRPCADRPTSPR